MYSVLDSDPRFKANFGMVICGRTMSCKTVFVSNLIEHRSKMIDKPPERIVYCFGQYQPYFAKLQKVCPNIELIKGFEPIFESDSFFDVNVPTMLILDDLASEISNDSRAAKL